MMKLAMTVLLLSVQLWAGNGGLPKLFSQMGDPLFVFAQKVQELKDEPLPGSDAAAFSEHAERVRRSGLAAEKLQEGSAKSAYLKQLRSLQKEYDRLMVSFKREMLASIKAEDTARFLQLVSTEPAIANKDRGLREKIMAYYEAKGLAGRSPFLDRMVGQKTKGKIFYMEGEGTSFSDEDDAEGREYRPVIRKPSAKKPVERRHQNVIVIGTPTCPYCIKARKFLRAQGIPFRDLNVNTSIEGRTLYKRNGGHGVPLILIGNTRITGFNPDAIMRAYAR